MGWEGHVARTGEMRNAYNILVENLKGRHHSEDLGVDVKITSEWILRKSVRKMWTGFIWLKLETSGGLL
jgi:hypothetical protein